MPSQFSDLITGASFQMSDIGFDPVEFDTTQVGEHLSGPSYGNPWAAQDWMDYFQQIGNADVLPMFDISTLPDYDLQTPGIQTGLWEGQIVGGTDILNEPYFTADPYQIAEQMAWWGGLPPEEIGDFIEDYGSHYIYDIWGDPSEITSFAGQQVTEQQQRKSQEAALWNEYGMWQEGRIAQLQQDFEGYYEDFLEAEEDIDLTRTEKLKTLIDERRSSERMKSVELGEARRKAGRTGFGLTEEYDFLLKEAELELREKTLSASDITSQVNQEWEQLQEQVENQAENTYGQFILDQSGQLTGINTQMEVMRAQFATASQGIYSDWVAGLVASTGTIMQQMDPEEYSDFQPFDWDPEADYDLCANSNCPNDDCDPSTGLCGEDVDDYCDTWDGSLDPGCVCPEYANSGCTCADGSPGVVTVNNERDGCWCSGCGGMGHPGWTKREAWWGYDPELEESEGGHTYTPSR